MGRIMKELIFRVAILSDSEVRWEKGGRGVRIEPVGTFLLKVCGVVIAG